MPILLTGFEPFAEILVNPSQLIVEHFAAQKRENLHTMILPTAYQASGQRLDAAIRALQPDAVIALGVAQSRSTISLERIAVNVDDASLADNVGVIASGDLIAPDGPTAYWSTLPLPAMREALAAHGIPVSISNHAGTYICNHAFYTARHTLKCLGMNVPCGFIHVPDLEKIDGETRRGLPLQMMIDGVEICVQTVESLLVRQPAGYDSSFLLSDSAAELMQ